MVTKVEARVIVERVDFICGDCRAQILEDVEPKAAHELEPELFGIFLVRGNAHRRESGHNAITMRIRECQIVSMSPVDWQEG